MTAAWIILEKEEALEGDCGKFGLFYETAPTFISKEVAEQVRQKFFDDDHALFEICLYDSFEEFDQIWKAES